METKLQINSRALTEHSLGSEAAGNLHLPCLRGLSREFVLTREFQPLVDLCHGMIEVKQGTCSAYNFRVTLRAGNAFRAQQTLEAFVDEMNAQFPAMRNYPQKFCVGLSGNSDMERFLSSEHCASGGDVRFTCSSLIWDSTYRHHYLVTEHNGKERTPWAKLLAEYNLNEVPNDIVRAVVGGWRLARGFPARAYDIGTEHDCGDLLGGMVTHTAWGRYSSSVATYRGGVLGFKYKMPSSLMNGACPYAGVVGGSVEAPGIAFAKSP